MGFIDPRPYVKNLGYAEPPNRVMYFFTAPGAFRTDDITRTDLHDLHHPALRECRVVPASRGLEPLQRKGVVAVDSTVLTASPSSGLSPFDPFNDKPVRGVHYDLAPTFGKPTSSADYQLPRTFRVSVGVRS